MFIDGTDTKGRRCGWSVREWSKEPETCEGKVPLVKLAEEDQA